MWLVAQEACLTQNQLGEGLHYAPGVLCVTGDEENSSDLYLHCPVASQIWSLIMNLFKPYHASYSERTPYHLEDSVCWILWKERNARCFEGKSRYYTKELDAYGSSFWCNLQDVKDENSLVGFIDSLYG